MVKTYITLIIAIFFEVAGTMLIPVTQNFTKVTPSVILAICYMSAFYLLTFVVNKIPIAIVYATWSGLGIFTIAILGYIFFKEKLINVIHNILFLKINHEEALLKFEHPFWGCLAII